jgi:hypothetical protein
MSMSVCRRKKQTFGKIAEDLDVSDSWFFKWRKKVNYHDPLQYSTITDEDLDNQIIDYCKDHPKRVTSLA